mmetsp:Transcript_14568/g.40033  ORF Transcript_14568/g.40033 Transcript_14568/m.40033 type:complete len:395 (-) Transcript_14568:800-1984(-)
MTPRRENPGYPNKTSRRRLAQSSCEVAESPLWLIRHRQAQRNHVLQSSLNGCCLLQARSSYERRLNEGDGQLLTRLCIERPDLGERLSRRVVRRRRQEHNIYVVGILLVVEECMEPHGCPKVKLSCHVVHHPILARCHFVNCDIFRRLPGVAKNSQQQACAHCLHQVSKDHHHSNDDHDQRIVPVNFFRQQVAVLAEDDGPVDPLQYRIWDKGRNDDSQGEPLEGVQDHHDHDACQRRYGDEIEKIVEPEHAEHDAECSDCGRQAASSSVEAINSGETNHGVATHPTEESRYHVGNPARESHGRSVCRSFQEIVHHLRRQKALNHTRDGEQCALAQYGSNVVCGDEAHVVVVVQEKWHWSTESELLHITNHLRFLANGTNNAELDEHRHDNGQQ